MVNTNKILTVSYGTFSCTLEGFDDSFGTMKAIAEYFRDLAADDRYFGAEPPAPDAEMLARIAEREIARRVEAKVDKENIVLRADPGSILPVAARAAEPEQAPEQTPEQSPVHDLAVDSAAPAVQPEEPVAPAVVTDVAADVVTDVVTESDRDGIEGLDDILTSEAQEDTADHMVAPEPEPEPESEPEVASEPAPEPEPVVETEAAEFFKDSKSDLTADANSVAAKLQRIRAVVDHEADTQQDGAYSEDEHAEDFAQDFLAEAHDDIEAALAIDDEAEELTADWDEEVEDDDSNDDIAALLDRFGVDDGAEDVAAEHEETDEAANPPEPEIQADPAPEESAESAEEDPAPVRARVIKMKRADFEAAVASGELEEHSDTGDTPQGGLSAEDEADLMRELAAVEAELHQAPDDAQSAPAHTDQAQVSETLLADILAEDETEEVQDASNDHPKAEPPMDLSGFSSDDADDADDDFGADSIFAEADDDDPETAPRDRADRATAFNDDADSDMNRMFDKAATEMNEETGKDRRNAIAHLRAAVAAAKAEEGAGGNLKSHGPDTEVYRDDLDSVVRPRHPGSPRAHTERPAAPRPAPLKLVAEQRIDLDDAAQAQPVRPRRVSRPQIEQPVGNPGDFADYAEDMGANTLPELLEAAAAYLSFVEGREQFSRPQLMTQVRQVEPEDFSREDGLRSFGQLLREGKIEKLEGGRFKASDSISYRPDARNVG